MTTLVLLDTNAYLRLAKRIQPLLGVEFGHKKYSLTVLKAVEDEVSRQPRLRLQYPWFDNEPYRTERLAKRFRLSSSEKSRLEAVKSVLLDHVGVNSGQFIFGGRSPPGDTDCYCLAFGQIRDAIVVTDDIGMHDLANDFDLTVWHGWELLKKMQSAKMIGNDKIREIYDALERNGDLTKSWIDAKYSEFKKVFGKKPKTDE